MKLKDTTAQMQSPVVLSPAEFDGKTASALFIISTTSRDRDGDVMVSEGCLDTLHTYAANPVVLFDHGESEKMPIGLSEYPDSKRLTVEVSKDQIKARVFFHCETLISSQVARLTEKKVLRASSIGYKGIDADPIDPRRPKAGMIYHQWELVEWSIVPVGSNQDAILQALGCKWEGKALAEPIAMRFKSLLRPSKKLILPATIHSTRKKAMSDDQTIDTTADETSQLPAGAQGIKVLLAGIMAGLAQVKEVYPTIEQPQVIKLLDKFIANTEKGMADLTKQAAGIYPDLFEEVESSEETETEPSDEEEIEEVVEPTEDADDEKDDDVSDVGDADEEKDKDKSKSLKTATYKSYTAKDCEPHVNTIKDATELLDDMSKSANIPSGYKRQCKGVLPGLTGIASFLTGKAETEDEPVVDDTKADDAEEDEAKSAELVLKALQEVSTKQAANAKLQTANAEALAQIKGK